MVTVSIDGRSTEVAEGTNLIEAARTLGIEIPTYCYHPSLSVVGQCRICFVEVEKAPRLLTACSTVATEGMVVWTASERVREARAAVMEFLLENHPLDCPVCDQAGECSLQDYSVEHGADTTRMVDERRTFPGLERRLIGPHVVQNQNRCIHCTRCIRFTREISETGDLTMKSRGNHSYIDTFDGSPLDNPWSACVADVCPVGALTVREFRFRARVWHLEETRTLCPGCSIGCNVTLGHHKGVVHRFVPRENREVNGWWMCDHGRLLAQGLNRRDLERPARRSAEGVSEITWGVAIDDLAHMVAAPGLRVVVSAELSNEALLLVKRILVEHAGAAVVVPREVGDERRVKNGRGEWIRRADAHPNSTGARLVGLEVVDGDRLRSFVEQAGGPVLLLEGETHPWLAGEGVAATLAAREVALVGRLESAVRRSAALILPAASWAETEGTYTSSTGRVQLARRAFPPHAEALPTWQILHRLGQRLGLVAAGETSPAQLFEELAAEVPAFAGMTVARLATAPGLPLLEEVANVG